MVNYSVAEEIKTVQVPDVEKALAKMIGARQSKLTEEDRQQDAIQKMLNDMTTEPPKMREAQEVKYQNS